MPAHNKPSTTSYSQLQTPQASRVPPVDLSTRQQTAVGGESIGNHCDALYFNSGTKGESVCAKRTPRGEMSLEVRLVDLIELPPVSYVGKHDESTGNSVPRIVRDDLLQVVRNELAVDVRDVDHT
jgi:hypothetical protein